MNQYRYLRYRQIITWKFDKKIDCVIFNIRNILIYLIIWNFPINLDTKDDIILII